MDDSNNKSDTKETLYKVALKWERFVPIIITIFSCCIVVFTGLLPMMFDKGFFSYYAIDSRFVEKTSYLYNDYAMTIPMSFLSLLLGMIFLFLLSWDTTKKVLSMSVYIDQNYDSKAQKALYCAVCKYYVKKEWWKFLILFFMNFSLFHLLDSSINNTWTITSLSTALSYTGFVTICGSNSITSSFIDSIKKHPRHIRKERSKHHRDKRRNKLFDSAFINTVGNDGTAAGKIIDELNKPRTTNKLDIINSISPNEETIPLMLVAVTLLMMLSISGIAIIASYGQGKDYARVKNNYYITDDGAHVALPVTLNKYAILDADINDSSITIHTQEITFSENTRPVKLHQFKETIILDVDGKVKSTHTTTGDY